MEDLQQLITECMANNRLSQEKLYRKFYPALFLLCRKFFSDNNEALEVLNDGMLQVFTHLDRYSAAKGDFFNWIYTVVRNTALDKLRRKKWPPNPGLGDDFPAVAEEHWSKLDQQDIYKLLDALPPATRAVCCLYYLEGFVIREISEMLQLSTGTIKWHLSETRSKLKPILEQYYLKNKPL
ncbi:RNA polymerase sigma factor [Chitinophaga vietnamensis]|uniref:RNA polymerase sigma factor n=1 Tax=Chitinophaga vietnamensis TaxID=2593957 RepID=UPI001F34FF59|nr:sigma-70 family RNA polymerase sigma factor [Chitinophaga vietnamensis]